MCGNIAAGIVLFNPDIGRLKQNLDAVCPQVTEIILVDNGSQNIIQIQTLLKDYKTCMLIRNSENGGIAKALNQMMAKAERKGYDWVLTLDDDSVCEPDMIEKLSRCLTRENAGIICPVAVDDKMAEKAVQPVKKTEAVRDCITAGSLTNVAAWSRVGGFDEKMFIDFVDIEFCTRLRSQGYQIIQVGDTFIHQQYGNIKGSFRLLGRTYYLFGYSPMRIYYSVRNQIYYMKKHYSRISVPGQLFYLLGYIGKRLVFENSRRKSFVAIIKGVRDGIKMHI